ncbi:lipid A-modifier LpxR family protein [Hyphobacterium marinum]|uniref:Lipid A-modifier LpxR family protein n=1 Tax=Hyphobacterium marinum TaxID=3116574 RepID=A0ABU7LW56_9PROT|nr:lipid A-modifier LpxR family protein [Hyphobacterium sp. Y6023]MEE2565777.1 lipid A-modifier LpxR family protein [Hyphobacterium sp. Y6023]
MRRFKLRRHVYAGTVAMAGVLGGMVSPGWTMDANWSPSQAILAPLMSEYSAPAQPTAQPEAEQLAISAMDGRRHETGAISAFAGERVSRAMVNDTSAIEVRVYNPGSDQLAGRLYRIRSDSDPVVIQPEQEGRSSVAVDYVARFDSPGAGDELDLAFIPRAGVSFGPDGSAAGAGAQVRIGQYFDEAGDGRPSWYAFAGAERRAVLYDPAQGFDLTDAMTYENYTVVGDVQAGVAMRLGDVDLSLAYVRRETKYTAGASGFNEHEDFAAVSLTRTW